MTAVRRRDASRNRAAIVTAARAALRERLQLSLGEIAARAGVGAATLYRHFPNREALEREALRQVLLEEAATALELVRPDDPRGSFVDISSRVIDVIASVRPPGSPPLDIPDLMGDVFEEFAGPVAESLAQGQREGTVRDDVDVRDILWIMQIMVTGFSVPSATPDVRRRYLALLFDALSPAAPGHLPSLET